MFSGMGGSKFRIGRVKKYTDQQKRKPKTLMVSIPRAAVSLQLSPSLSLMCSSPLLSDGLQHSGHTCIDNQLTVSLPISIYVNGRVTSVNMLSHRLSMLQLPPQWVVASNSPLTLCTIGLQERCMGGRVQDNTTQKPLPLGIN